MSDTRLEEIKRKMALHGPLHLMWSDVYVKYLLALIDEQEQQIAQYKDTVEKLDISYNEQMRKSFANRDALARENAALRAVLEQIIKRTREDFETPDFLAFSDHRPDYLFYMRETVDIVLAWARNLAQTALKEGPR